MAWPNATDFLEAVQDLPVSMADEELQAGEVARTPLGLPMLWSGNFADVFKIHCPATGNSWALKCFTREVAGQRDRYRRIAAHLEHAQLPFTVDFQYLEQGIRIGGQWFPALKMRWVEGLTLAEFVEEHLDRPGNLKMLLDLWVKLATRLREAEVAHADLQHGNVLLVPMSGGSFALRLIDYDGMYVPSLAGTRSGEVGHPAYQHPQRLREGTYNAKVDRFSHLSIYCGILCLMRRGRDLWQRFNNGDNLLFREGDFLSPRGSPLFRLLWTDLVDPEMRALVGRLILACGRSLDQTPPLEEIIVNGEVLPLSRKEVLVCESRLDPAPLLEEVVAERMALPPTSPPPPSPPERITPATTTPETPLATAEGTNVGRALARRQYRRFRVLGTSLWGGLAAAGRSIVWPFRRLVGAEKNLLRGLVWAVILAAVLVEAWIAGTLWRTSRPPHPTPPPPVQLKIRRIESQTVEAGKSLRVPVSLENPDAWTGKVRFGLGFPTLPGMRIDAATGIFTWTPTEGQAADKHEVRVSVTGSDGRSDETSFVVNVLRPPPPLRFQPISPQTVEAGKPLSVAATVENSTACEGKLRFSLGPQSPVGATVNRETGELTWTPPSDQPAGKYDVTVLAQGPNGQTAQRTFVVTVTPSAEIAVELGNGVKLKLVLIRDGEFLMGSPDLDEHAINDETPQHRVRISKPFYLGKYLVTQEQWKTVMGNNPSRFKGPRNPVEQVSWEDCREFVEKLNVKAGGGTFSLPTEAQWEYACRAGSTTRYCFGDDESGLDEYAWYDKANKAGKSALARLDQMLHRNPQPVGGKKPNAFQLYDMHGNVWEWCQDWYDEGYYAKSPAVDPTGPAGGSGRVFRGGSCRDPAWSCRSAYRYDYGPGYRSYDLGFRVARVLAEPRNEIRLTEPPAPLKIRPVPPQTIEVGKRLAVVVSVQDAERWWGKLRFSLAPNAPPGASIDPQTGEFSWAPPLDQAAGKYDVTVSVQGLDDQTVQTTLVVTVIRPIAARPTLPGKEIAVDLGDGVKLEMVLIPAGEFLMGSPKSDKDAGPAEQPQHRVRIKPFYLGKYLVTQGQWHAVMGSNPSLFMGPKNPVENVNWSDCQVFLGKLNEKISGQGGNFVLPTEAQWEYACRAGSTKRYCFGDEESGLGEYAWYAANSNGKTHPVGEKKPNAWGLYDMHGNVWEWCQDWYDAGYYAKSPTGDPTGSRGGLGRVGRGGSWHGPAGFCRSAARDGDGPGDRNSNLGFRVARVPEPAAALKVEPISPRTIEAGKPMTVAVSVEDAQRWKGNVLYSLVSNAPLGASIDETTGEFSWIPPSDQAAGRYDVTVSAQSLDGQTAQMTFVVTVTRPIPTSAKLTGKEIAVDVGNGVKLELVLIPADEFLMGEPDETGHDDPRHRVRITKPFYLGKYLVTQEQWEAVMGSNPSHFKGPKNPVEQVSWGDCRKFVEELDARVGGGKFSLPTEAQWEYACRAGSTTRYCFGDDELRLDEYAWFRENSGRQTHPVGEKKPNAWGLYDMHGNVYEWCQDWYDGYYAGSPTNDPTGPSEGSCHVFRGGSWDNGAGGCGSACREGFIDESQPRLLAILGFRVARVPAESPPSMTALRLQPIAEQTVEAGKPLTLAAPVDNADAWKGKLQYRLAGPRLPGARIDPQSGEFSWTPPSDQAAGKHDVSVSVEAPGGRKDQTTFTITVTRPPPWGERELAVEVTPGVKLEMVLIPVGEFLMGSPDSDKDASEDDKPQHRVRITKPFYLGKYLVTQEQWKAVMGNNPSVRTWPKNPVEQVSWEDCRGFVEKLNTKMGSGKFTLPTEAQWEYACRARSTSRYCFGDNESGLDEYAWYLGRGPRVAVAPQRLGRKKPNASIQQDGYKATVPGPSCQVGKKKPNAWGLYDMHGNVWEWCQDWYDGDYYANSPTDDPTGPDTGSHRVARGGSSTSPAEGCRSAYRNRYAPEIRNDCLGFRVARVPANK